MDLKEFLDRQIFVVNGFQVTVGLVALLVVAVIVWQRFLK